MLFDFCDGQTKSQISCDKVCTDSNPVENLISMEYMKKNCGFIGENFVRPPVNITLQFPCNIELFRVVINPVVGAQKSSGFEIYSSSNKVDTTPLISNQSCKTSTNSSLFVPLGKIGITETGVICFTNHRFRHRDENERNLLPPIEQYSHHGDLRHGRQSALTFISHLTVRITRTFSGSAVCIRKLEVWGRPSKSCSEHAVKKLMELFSPISYTNKCQDETNLHKNKQDGLISNHDLCHEKDLDIPEDFLDSITFEIMTVPMRLPCGKNIDQLTLEKHNTSEALWGRMPSDPYTGMVFDSARKAVPNAPLKGRIDQFVLANMDKLKGLPRTLGKDQIQPGHSISRLATVFKKQSSEHNSLDLSASLSHHDNNIPPHIHTNTGNNLSETLNTIQVVDLTGDVQTESDHIEGTIGKKRQNKEIIDLVTDKEKVNKCNKRTKCDDVIDLTEPYPSTNMRVQTHATDLTDSLNSALATALGTLPSFTRTVQTKENTDCCCLCQTTNFGVSYGMPCSHLICRSCLNKSSNSVVCEVCGTQVDRKDVVRVHI